MIVIGVGPHKRVHTASAVEPGTNRRVATVEVDASLTGYRRLLRWSAQFEEHRWAVENARGLGRHMAQWLVARGERVDDVVPSTATARVRELSRGGRRKNDVIGLGNARSPPDICKADAVLSHGRHHRSALAAGTWCNDLEPDFGPSQRAFTQSV